ncbi:bifunctional phosphopantothenoylcysteine decarboxylase/phosphopantothenate--cysteine ligase CoaBC [Methylocapsa sp. S129]|uniref:bifunctional phosphopantothenoylcysteine decarboxylase/phosphopantothenate--cysteine ligase CoaBC n=1 Tax=Methylocapsa sp. S129 TaxID=1641869 RepID=UPI00131B960E|nr:bifunctional phosphopantothenoylcysteine decarboxylase/phosphopantothenate--cysteine ligase CoaBC [Methylocapsa sp. S129]
MTETSLSGSRILLVIGGGIAAYKALELIRRLHERGSHARVVMTAAARQFITPLSAAALSGDKVYEDLFSLTDEAEMGHIELSREADLVVVAPATADLLARMANGLANDLATTALLATDKKTLVAPAMNLRMWLHPATQRNVGVLRNDGILFVGPDDGDMACGEYGPGRMAEPMAIVAAIEDALSRPTTLALPPGVGRTDKEPKGPLAGKHVLVTSGPTHEPIDPVRFIGNRSSGQQGHAIAQAAAKAGARVTLVSGPVCIADPAGVETVHVESAREMLASVEAAMPADIFIAAAAVADWRVEHSGAQKMKKGAGGPPRLTLIENPDILAAIGRNLNSRPALIVGFAAETENLIENARRKLEQKGCDLILANSVAEGSGTFGGKTNAVHLVTPTAVEAWPTMSKQEVAARLVDRLAAMLHNKS